MTSTRLTFRVAALEERVDILEAAAEMRRDRIERLADSINNLRLALDAMQVSLAKIERAANNRGAAGRRAADP